jgi:hypothetical protein
MALILFLTFNLLVTFNPLVRCSIERLSIQSTSYRSLRSARGLLCLRLSYFRLTKR